MFKIKFRGRNGYKWVNTIELPTVLTAAYFEIVEESEIRLLYKKIFDLVLMRL